MVATSDRPLGSDEITNEELRTNDELRAESARLQAENAQLRAENQQVRATLDAYIARARSTAMFGPCEMTAGTSVGPRRHRGRES